jgi:stage II sporulation protein AA (anti-sigma F factor antagonist)
MAGAPPFECVVTSGPRQATCALGGELDLMTAPRLRQELRPHLDDDAVERLTFDLADLRFVDSSGFQALIDVRRELAARGRTMTVVRPQRTVRMVLEMMGLDDVLDASDELPG